jgi:hypothetical protein
LRFRVGFPLRFVLAILRSSALLIDLYIPLEAPLSEDTLRFPRLAPSAAPAAICCFFDFAGIHNCFARGRTFGLTQIKLCFAKSGGAILPIRFPKMKDLRRLIPVLIVSAALPFSSCYVFPVKNIEGSFRGLDSCAVRAAKADKPATVRILMVHGMGKPQPQVWEKPLVDGIARKMDLSPDGESSKKEFWYSKHLLGILWRYPFVQRKTGVPVRMYALTWTPATEGWKDKKFETDERYSHYRLAGDRFLKKDLMDARFSDAVLYAGEYREHMQYPIVESVSYILRDNFGPADELAIITESLGSYMTYDTLLRMSNGYSFLHEKNYNPYDARRFVGQTSTIYMLANQIPLLELSDVNNPPSEKKPSASVAVSDSGSQLMKQFAKVRAAQAPAGKHGVPLELDLNLVAFSDPNDLLSYPISDADVLTRGRAPENIHVSYGNVTYSLARWSLFWIVVDPIKAHTGHASSNKVLNLIVHGHNARNAPGAEPEPSTPSFEQN